MINLNHLKNSNSSIFTTRDSLISFCEAMIENLTTTENKIFFNDLLSDLQAGNPRESGSTPIPLGPTLILQPVRQLKDTKSPYILLDKTLIPDTVQKIKLYCKANSQFVLGDLQLHHGLVFITDQSKPLTYDALYRKLGLTRIEAIYLDFCSSEEKIDLKI